MKPPRFIYLYDGAKTDKLGMRKIANYLKRKLEKAEVIIRDDFIVHHLSSLPSSQKEERVDFLAKKLAGLKIRKVNEREFLKPLPGEVEYEKRKLHRPELKSFGILYEGFKLAALFSGLIPEGELSSECCHIAFTNQFFGTWDHYNHRYHARVSIYSFPSLISTTGLVEAPAKPKEFYLRRQLGADEAILKEEFKDRFIDYEDPRLTEVMKGYVLQALFFHMTGHPFCKNKNCRLYNAHWQEEMIHAQLETPHELCKKHQTILHSL
jgi:hypothetical protein